MGDTERRIGTMREAAPSDSGSERLKSGTVESEDCECLCVGRPAGLRPRSSYCPLFREICLLIGLDVIVDDPSNNGLGALFGVGDG